MQQAMPRQPGIQLAALPPCLRVRSSPCQPEKLHHVQAIALPAHAFHEAALQRQNSLTKPAGSLGVLETVACRFAWQGQHIPTAAAITVFAGDHGVTAKASLPIRPSSPAKW
jgi:NaMN:DMB phosphoribosyltransferase